MSAQNQLHADEFPEDEAAEDQRSAEGFASDTDSPEISDERAMQSLLERAATEGRQKGVRGKFIEKSKASISERELLDPDEAVFLRYQQGDQKAFLEIYSRFKANIYAYCAHILLSVGMDRGDVDDAFQEVFLRVAQYQHTFIGGEFKAWIFTVARHTCLSAKRKWVRHRRTTEYTSDSNGSEESSSEVRNAMSHSDSPLEAMSKSEQTELLLKAIASLPETYREALILSDYEGLTYDEIGRLTGTSLSTIRIRIFRAKARLRKVLLPILGESAQGLKALEIDDKDL